MAFGPLFLTRVDILCSCCLFITIQKIITKMLIELQTL